MGEFLRPLCALFMPFAFTVLFLRTARTMPLEACEAAPPRLEKLAQQLRAGIAIEYSAGALLSLSQACSIPLRTWNFSERDLVAAQKQGAFTRYKNSLELIAKGVSVDANVLQSEGRRIGKTEREISREYQTNLDKHLRSPTPHRLSPPSECQPVDLRSNLPPVRDQGPISWCQSVVLADLIGFRMQKALSATAIGWNYSAERLGTSGSKPITIFYLQDGSIEGAFSSLQKNPLLCHEDDLPLTDLYVNMRALAEFYGSLNQNQTTNELSQSLRKNLFGLFPNVPEPTFLETVRSNPQSTFFRRLAELSCKTNFDLPSDLRLRRHDAPIIEKLHALLNQNTLGALFYDQSFLVEPRTKLASPNHISLIVGRRWNQNTNRCEFLLRNSHGEGCDYSNHFKCGQGELWIPEDYLGIMARSLYWMP